MTTDSRGPRPGDGDRGPRVHWYLPTAGDGRDIVGWAHSRTATDDPRAVGRPPDPGYLADVARAAERLGFESVLTPTGTWCEDAWITTAALTAQTSTLTFIVALRPDSIAPTLAAQMAATFHRQSGGRLALNIVTGSDEQEQRRFGDRLEHDRRYERTEEFLRVLRGAWGAEPFDFRGEHYDVTGATVGRRLDGPPPTVYLGGASPAAADVSARHADVHLAWGEPPKAVAAQLDGVRERAAALDRPAPEFGIRLHVITRDTAAEAWAQADRMLAALDPEAIAVARRRFAASTSVGQRRMTALTDGGADRLEVAPNLWAGFALVRRHAGTALVGSHQQVAERIAEYRALGVEHFILSGQPHLEEAYTVGEELLPLLRKL
ncbi:Alkanesulfonate monooxygenase [Catenulispora acidiphila DSM 44928]|uniref:Alkanesulfonate monooxygenase n=1 Tax=Catenulispora acidiphila (strain DSM 44928 / JCM 14897 / NBRC 102108 / NRRL B-24433 / ID139908) TaxID=479433 RepID=C7Q111_CATAD|nr:LLM class flavin-dependent oxidoreductase [Catenulispora acidiphila]ACU71686.1 Alkanesulfonate monooxygenase [Catenulispora acidiphila DSM 44928]